MPPTFVPANPAHARFRTGAIPTPRHKLVAARQHQIEGRTPAQVIVVPPFLEMWLNDQYGDCVTAEEAFAKAAYSVFSGLPETKITDQTVKAFCDQYGFLDGAMLTDVMDKMVSNGFQQDQGYKDGPYASVDYSNEAVLQNAISLGPVKIGISSSSLPSGAGNQNGWYAFGGQGGSQDHCVAIPGFGPTAALFGALNVPVPSGAPASGYLLYTWSTIGVVDHSWIMAACGEAWIRNPTTVGINPTPPTPPTPPPPSPTVLQGTLAITGPADAAGTYLIGSSGGLTLEQIATLQQADALIMSLLPPAHSGQLTAEDMTALYAAAMSNGLSPRVNWIQLVMDLIKLANDFRAKNWPAVIADVQAILKDLAT